MCRIDFRGIHCLRREVDFWDCPTGKHGLTGLCKAKKEGK